MCVGEDEREWEGKKGLAKKNEATIRTFLFLSLGKYGNDSLGRYSARFAVIVLNSTATDKNAGVLSCHPWLRMKGRAKLELIKL